MRLGNRVLAVSLLPALLGTTGSTAFLYAASSRALLKTAERTARLELEICRSGVGGFLSERLEILSRFARAADLSGGSGVDLNVRRNLRAWKAALPSAERLYYHQVDGGVYDADGLRANVRDRYYFPAFLRGEKIVTGSIISRASGRSVILILVPIRNSAGKVVGGLGATIRIEEVVRRVSDLRLENGGFLLIIDDEGNVLSGQEGRPRGFVKPEDIGGLEFKTFTDSVPKARTRASVRRTVKRRELVLQSAPLAPTLWTIGVAFDKEKALKPIRQARNKAFGVLAASLVVAASAGVAANRWILRPLATMEASLKTAANGDFSVRVPEGGPAELAVIMAHTELLERKGAVGEDTVDSVGAIKQACLHARDVAQDMLSLARGWSPRRERVDLVAIIREVILLLRGGLPQSVRVEFGQTPANPVFLETDPVGLRRVFVNLISNGIHALGAEQGVVFLRVTTSEIGADHPTGLPAGRYAAVDVVDNGRGMNDETVERVFEPFFTRGGSGSGIGLAVAERFVSDQGGLITVESTLGEGSTFRVFLPVVV